MTDRELMQQASEIEMLAKRFNEGWHEGIKIDALDIELLLDVAAALRERLSQPDQEPVAWMYEWDGRQHLTFTDQRFVEKAHPHFNKSTPLFTYPPTWPPLATEEIEQCCYEADSKAADHPQTWKWTEAFARAIQSKLKERNT